MSSESGSCVGILLEWAQDRPNSHEESHSFGSHPADVNTLVYQNFASVRASVRATGAGLNFWLDFLNAVLFLTFQSSCCKLRCLRLVVPQGHSQSEATSSQPSMRNMFLESYCL